MQWSSRSALPLQAPFRALLVVAAALLFGGCRDELVHDLVEKDAIQLVAKLYGESISAERSRQSDGRWTVEVERGDYVKALGLLERSRFLRTIDAPRLEQSSIISSREDQRFRHERALSREIELTLATIHGVLETKAHLNLPEEDPIFGAVDKTERPSASVLLVVTDQFSVGADKVAALVAGASGIPVEGVAVLVTRGRTDEATVPQSAPIVASSSEGASPVSHAAAAPPPSTGALVSSDAERPASGPSPLGAAEQKAARAADGFPWALIGGVACLLIGLIVVLATLIPWSRLRLYWGDDA